MQKYSNFVGVPIKLNGEVGGLASSARRVTDRRVDSSHVLGWTRMLCYFPSHCFDLAVLLLEILLPWLRPLNWQKGE